MQLTTMLGISTNISTMKFLIALISIALLIVGVRSYAHVSGGHGGSSMFNPGFEFHQFISEEVNREEFSEFCVRSFATRINSHVIPDEEHGVSDEECGVVHAGEFAKEVDLKVLFTLILIIVWGAILRASFIAFDVHFPYTVVLMLSGLVVGALSRYFCENLHEYTAIARVSAKLIMYTFLPILIFESAFSIPVHTFRCSLVQILLVSFPGMIIQVFMTGTACQVFLGYDWDYNTSLLFGAIISATDPVAVVAILRELGVSERLSVMIEGESLMNDGVAILLFEIFDEFIKRDSHDGGETDHGTLHVVTEVIISFVRIAIGGPAFGWIMGRIMILLLSYVFNDAPVEISATIVSAYITYWMSEDILGVSGVMAVVLLGLTLKAQRTVISPDSEAPVHHFWQIIGYLANTVLFGLVGIVITETALNDVDPQDWYNVILLFIIIHVSRFTMLMIMYPILKKTGYGTTWQNIIIMMWGGLRGAVGICLSLEVFRSEHHCHKEKFGSKMLLLTAAIVFLTLVVNGTTTKTLLTALSLTEVSLGRKEDMNNAVKRIRKIQNQAIRMFQGAPYMYEADWTIVKGLCHVKNPYENIKVKEANDIEEDQLEVPVPISDNYTQCPECGTLVNNDPTKEEYENLVEEARFKVIRTMKVSYTHRNTIGLTSDKAFQNLMTDAESAEDKYRAIIYAKSLLKYTKNRGTYLWFHKKLLRLEKDSKGEKPKAKWREPFWRLVNQNWFEATFVVIVLLNMIPVLYDVVTDIMGRCDSTLKVAFYYVNIVFTVLYILEFLFTVFGHVFRDLIRDPWKYMDFFVLILTIADSISYKESTECLERNENALDPGSGAFRFLLAFRLLKLSRALKLLRPIIPGIETKVSQKISEQLFVGYDIGRTYIVACEEVLKLLPQMVENKKVLKIIKEAVEHEKEEAVLIMESLRGNNIGTAIALKTMQACRSVINSMFDKLQEIKNEGLLDDTEVDILTRILELRIKRLWNSPTQLTPDIEQQIYTHVSWLDSKDEDIFYLIERDIDVIGYTAGDIICRFGDDPTGIYVVVGGTIRIRYIPEKHIMDERNRYGKLPNSELYSDFTFSTYEDETFSTGFVFGEFGSLTGFPWASTIRAETSVVLLFIPRHAIKYAMDAYNDPFESLEGEIWKSIAQRRAAGLLFELKQFQKMSSKDLQKVIKNSIVPITDHNVFDIPDFINEVVVLEGTAMNADTNETYVAPLVVPPNCRRLVFLKNPVTVNRFLVVSYEELPKDDESLAMLP